MNAVDLAVIGGSFAGLACARAAAGAGLRVRVLDWKREAGENVRTTGLFVDEAARECPLPAHLRREISGVRLYAPSGRWVDLRREGYTFLATDTPGVLRWLAQRAEEAGAGLMWRAEYRTARREGGGFRIDGPELRSRYLAGADGAFSRVARNFGLGRNRSFLLGVEEEWEGVRGVDENFLHCFLSPRFAPGYIGWVVPGLGLTQIGLAGKAPFRPNLREFLEFMKPIFDFSRGRCAEKRVGWIPVGGPVKPSSAPGVLLLGDAAGHVSPLTGGGIRLALREGAASGAAIAAFLSGQGPDPAQDRSLGPLFWFKGLLRKAFEWGMTESVAETFITAALFRRAAAQVIF